MDDRDTHSSEQPEPTATDTVDGDDVIREEPFDPEQDMAADDAGPEGEAESAAESAPDSGDGSGSADSAEPEQGPAAEPAKPAKPTAEEQLEKAKGAAVRNREQMLRVAADFDNFRKRSVRDLDDARRRARQGVVRDMLPVFDNLERAVAHVDDASDPAAIAQGIKMVLKQFLDTLTRLDVARIDALGASFDPSIHESIQMIESADHEAGTIVNIIQPGYRHGEELIRPALVAVSKGPPAPPPAAEPAGDDRASSPPVADEPASAQADADGESQEAASDGDAPADETGGEPPEAPSEDEPSAEELGES